MAKRRKEVEGGTSVECVCASFEFACVWVLVNAEETAWKCRAWWQQSQSGKISEKSIPVTLHSQFSSELTLRISTCLLNLFPRCQCMD